jgi:hypothetical protein
MKNFAKKEELHKLYGIFKLLLFGLVMLDDMLKIVKM